MNARPLTLPSAPRILRATRLLLLTCSLALGAVSIFSAEASHGAVGEKPSRLFNAATALNADAAIDDISDEEVGLLQVFPQRIWSVEVKSKTTLGNRLSTFLGFAPAMEGNEPTRELLTTLRRINSAKDVYNTSDIEQFLKNHADSRWAYAMRAELARRRFRQGMLAQALSDWDSLWNTLKERTEPAAIEVADEALGHLIEAYIGLSNAGRLNELIGQQERRSGNAVIEAKIERARQTVWLLKHKGAQNVMCGPLAIYQILKAKAQPFVPIRLDTITDDYIATGISLSQIKQYSDQYNLDMVMRRKPAGAAIPTPAIVHLSAGHYASIVAEEEGKYLLVDRPMQFEGWVSLAVIEAQASGAYLVTGPATVGWRDIGEAEALTIFGRDGLHGQQPSGQSVTSNSPKTGGDQGDCGGAPGMPTYTFHPQVASLRVEDIPLGYTPPVGPAVYPMIAYNDLDDSKPTSAPTFSNVGRIWSLNWVAYIDHISGTLTNGRTLSVHVAGGGLETSTYSTATGRFGPDDRSFTTVTRTGTATYTRVFPDGSSEVYNTPNNATNPTRIFLSRKIDPMGNALVFAYDSTMRLTTVTDAIGQVTTLTYPTTGDLRKISKITDPFGRSASFTYDSGGNLSSVTDVIGLTSSFRYDSAGFMTSMTTPYGTTTFEKTTGTNSWDRTITATDPQGDKERVRYIEPIEIPGSEPSPTSSYNVGGTVVSFLVESGRQQFRNSFYWNKKAFKDAPDDVRAARNYRWLTDSNYLVTPILESMKEPLEGRVWFNYPNTREDSRLFLYYPSAGGIPNKTLRLLDDGTPQLNQVTYNSLGRPTAVIDPIGRTTTYTYAPDQMDVLEIRRKTGASTSDRLALFTYNTQHLPLTVTDASGQITTYAYNSRGQPTTITNAKNEVTAFAYNENGYLTSIDGPLTGTADTTSFTYHPTGDVRTVTGPDGYVVMLDYDALGRTTKITYPDGTTDQFIYTRLDRTGVRDRLGRLTTYSYNSLRQLVQVQDALNRVTRYEWCRCGAMRSLIDPLGRLTTWQQDVQGRTIGKTYADGSKIRYVFGGTTSRMQQVIDEKGQIAAYQYNPDGTLSQISYPNAAIATPTVTYTYDSNYTRILTMVDGTGTTTYAYNLIPSGATLGAGRLLSIDGPLVNDTITFQYDELGRLKNRAINGIGSTAAYDPAGRITTAVNALGSFSYTYDGATRRVASIAYPNGQALNFSYFNNAGDRRLEKITNARGVSPISQFSYSYNATGSITTWTQQADASPAQSYAATYDSVDQLTLAVLTQGTTALKTYRYTYDMAGNRTREELDGVVRQFAYNTLNELTTGNTSETTTSTYEWNGARRLTAIIQGANRSEFTYDGFGRRVRIVERQNSTVTSDRRFVWCDLEMCEERDAAGSVVKKQFFGQGVRTEGANLYYSTDHLGSIREITDSAGAVRARYEYDPYGRRTKLMGDIDADLGFTGHYYHSTTKLLLAPFRAYDMNLGRWLSRDPIEEEGGINLYAYVGNNPLNFWDPLGLQVNKNLFPEREPIRRSADNVPSEGNYKVGAHGNPSTVVDENGNPISPKDLAEKIKDDPNYSPGAPVDLLSCNTGRGENSYAERLAKELNAPVNAPDNFVWYYGNGNTVVAPAKGGDLKKPDLENPGRMRNFTPPAPERRSP